MASKCVIHRSFWTVFFQNVNVYLQNNSPAHIFLVSNMVGIK